MNTPTPICEKCKQPVDAPPSVRTPDGTYHWSCYGIFERESAVEKQNEQREG